MLHVLNNLQVHKCGRSAGQYTDREINILGALEAMRHTDVGASTHEFPSSAMIVWKENGALEVVGRVELDDLPEGVRPYVVGIAADKQSDLDRWVDEYVCRRDQGEG